MYQLFNIIVNYPLKYNLISGAAIAKTNNFVTYVIHPMKSE
jgi:hypothetical protein